MCSNRLGMVVQNWNKKDNWMSASLGNYKVKSLIVLFKICYIRISLGNLKGKKYKALLMIFFPLFIAQCTDKNIWGISRSIGLVGIPRSVTQHCVLCLNQRVQDWGFSKTIACHTIETNCRWNLPLRILNLIFGRPKWAHKREVIIISPLEIPEGYT